MLRTLARARGQSEGPFAGSRSLMAKRHGAGGAAEWNRTTDPILTKDVLCP